MHHEAQFLMAVGVIHGDQFSADRNAEFLLELTGDAGFDGFALLLFATGNPTSLPAGLLQPLVDQHLSRRINTTPTPIT